VRRPLAAAAAAALTAACAGAPPPPASPSAGLSGTGWSLATLAGEPVSAPVSLRFDGDRVEGRGPCNRFRGGYQEGPGAALRIGPVAASRAACPDLALEDRFFGALTDAARADLAPGVLTLSGADGAPLMTLTGG
jgi:heat shock protein HslJ